MKHDEICTAYNALMKFYPLTLGDLDGELWRPIDEHYHVSNFARVKSFWRGKARILKPFHSTDGYLRVTLFVNGTRQQYSVHRLTAEAFLQKPQGAAEVNHIDGHKLNNHVSNLEWCTHSQNIQHAFDMGLKINNRGHESARSVLSADQVAWCREVYIPRDRVFGATALAKRLGVHKRTILFAVHGEHYANAEGSVHEKFSRRIPEAIREEIRRLYRKGVCGRGAPALAKKFGCTASTILKVVRGN